MNVQLYNEVLAQGVRDFRPVKEMHDRKFVEGFEAELLRIFMELLSQRALKVGGDEETKKSLHNLVANSLSLLQVVCRKVTSRIDTGDADFETRVAQRWEQELEKARSLSTDKNNDYSPFNIFKCGSIGLITRLGDKLSRITNLLFSGAERKVKDESVVDTARDTVNYCVYMYMVAVDGWVTDEERAQWQEFLNRNELGDLVPFYDKVGEDGIVMAGEQDIPAEGGLS